MANAVPQWMLGKNLTVQMTPLTITGSTGVMVTSTSTVTFFGMLDNAPLSVQNQVEKVPISPSDNPNMNKVIIEQGSGLVLTEIIQAIAPTAIGATDANTGISANAIEKLAQTSFHYKMLAIWKDNSAGSVRTATYYVQYAGHGEEYVKGKSTMKMSLDTFSAMSAGAYLTNPAFS